MITWGNYEEYLMMHADGELSREEEDELMAFVNKNPALKKEVNAYNLTKLVPDTTVVFTEKNSLLKPETGKRIIGFPQWRRYSIAAGIALIVFVSVHKYFGTNRNGGELAIKHSVAPPTRSLPPEEHKVRPTVAAPDTLQKQSNDVAEINRERVGGRKKPANGQRSKNTHEEMVAHGGTEKSGGFTVVHDSVHLVEVASIKELPHPNESADVAKIKEVPAFTAQNSEPVRKTFWDKLPMDELKKKQMENIANAVAEAVNTNEDKPDKNVKVRVAKRKLMISF